VAYDGTVKIGTTIDESGASKGLDSIKKAVSAAVAVTTATVSAAAVKVGTYSVDIGSQFEKQMSRVKAISNATDSEFEALTEQAKELGAETAFSAQEAAEGMENLASAGFTVEEIMEAMPGMLDLAASSGEDLATSADIAASTLRGFGLEADQAAHVADVLAKNAADTNAAVADTGEAMKYVAPVANAMGLSMEEVAASIGIMANAGIKGGQAGTSLRGALSRLANPTDKMLQCMDNLNLSFYDSNGQMLSLTEMTAMLEESMGDLTDEQRNQALITLFGQESLSGMLALMEAGSDDVEALTIAYQNCDGAAADMAATMQDNLASKYEAMTGSLETFGITVYDYLESPLSSAAVSATDAIDRITERVNDGDLAEAVESIGEVVGDVAEGAIDIAEDAAAGVIQTAGWVIDNSELVIGVVGGIGAAWIAYKVATEGAAIGQAALNLAMNLNPAGVMIAGITGLAAGLTIAAATYTDVSDAYTDLADKADTTREKVEGLHVKMQDGETAFKNSKDAIEGNSVVAQRLADRLYNLNEKTDKTATEQMEMEGIVRKLNELIPDMNLAIDEQTGFLNKTREEVDLLTEAYKKQAIQQAYQERYTELMSAYADAVTLQVSAERDLGDAIVENQSAWDDYNQRLEKLNEEYPEFEDNSTSALNQMWMQDAAASDAAAGILELQGAYDEASQTVYDCENAIAEYEKEMEYAMEQYGLTTEATEGYSEATEDAGEVSEQTGESVSGMSDTLLEAASKVNELATELISYGDVAVLVSEETAEAWEELQDSWIDAYDAAKSSIEGQLGLFDTYTAGTAISISEAIAGLESQNEAMRNWAENMKILSKAGVEEGLLTELAKLGPEGYAQIQAFAEAITTGSEEDVKNAITTLNSVYKENLLLKENTSIEIADMQIDLQTGFNNMTGIAAEGSAEVSTAAAEGLGSADTAAVGNQEAAAYISAVENTVEDAQLAGETVSDATDTGLGSADVGSTGNSLLGSLLGIFTGGTILAGVAGTAVSVALNLGLGVADTAGTASKLAQKYTSAINRQDSAAWSSGYALSAGVAAGIEAGIPSVRSAASKSASAAISAFRATAQIHSPSRIAIEDGSDWSEGIEIGILNNQDDIGRAASGTASIASQEFYKQAKSGTDFDASSIVEQMKEQSINLSWHLTGGMEQEAAREKDVIALQAINSEQEIDYERLAEEQAKALNGMSITMDGKTVGGIITQYVDEGMDDTSDLRDRGVL